MKVFYLGAVFIIVLTSCKPHAEIYDFKHPEPQRINEKNQHHRLLDSSIYKIAFH